MENILRTLEEQAELDGMHLNHTNTEVPHDARKSTPTVRFKNGAPVPTTTQIEYPGSLVSWDKTLDVAFKHRAGIAKSSYQKLREVWNGSLSRRSKLRIFQSVFLSTLAYGLEAWTLHDNYEFLKRIDACHIRFLRRIVGIQASYYSRTNPHCMAESWIRIPP